MSALQPAGSIRKRSFWVGMSHFGDDEDYEGNHPERVYEIADGGKDGLWENFYEDGNLKLTQTFRNGVLFETNPNP